MRKTTMTSVSRVLARLAFIVAVLVITSAAPSFAQVTTGRLPSGRVNISQGRLFRIAAYFSVIKLPDGSDGIRMNYTACGPPLDYRGRCTTSYASGNYSMSAVRLTANTMTVNFVPETCADPSDEYNCRPQGSWIGTFTVRTGAGATSQVVDGAKNATYVSRSYYPPAVYTEVTKQFGRSEVRSADFEGTVGPLSVEAVPEFPNASWTVLTGVGSYSYTQTGP